ncbi:MAG: sigma-54-dependent transcriptional regulator [Betaproteobacteria bacterium]
MAEIKVLVVDDEPIARQNLAHALERDGIAADVAADAEEALALLAQTAYPLVLTDLRMPGMDGLTLLREIRQRLPQTEVIVITAHASTDSTVEAMRAGAFYYVEKPFRLPEVRKVVREALEKTALKAENASLRSALSRASGGTRIITSSPAMEGVLETAARVAGTDCTVLIAGETGTGKEVLARFLHEQSGRADKPFLGINCGALSEELLSNELFGHERGAFTGATAGKVGLLETAARGTLFLDEVTEMSAAVQVKLLRVLQEREFYRLGGREAIRTDVRIIAATNRDPQQCVEEGRLRQDLYFRLNVVGLRLPPLRERRGDIPPLAVYFLTRCARRMNKTVTEIAPEAFEAMLSHDFPGNVRELENLIERGVALAEGNAITLDLLPPELLRRNPVSDAPESRQDAILTLAESERRHIFRVLEQVGGNRALAAQMLGIDRVSLWRKLRRYEAAESS